MPRGDNPNSRKNLVVSKNLTPEQRRESASKAGKASGEKRKALKTFRELDNENTTDEERLKMLNALKKRAAAGDVNAWKIYAEFMGLKPSERLEVATIDPEAEIALKAALEDYNNKYDKR